MRHPDRPFEVSGEPPLLSDYEEDAALGAKLDFLRSFLDEATDTDNADDEMRNSVRPSVRPVFSEN